MAVVPFYTCVCPLQSQSALAQAVKSAKRDCDLLREQYEEEQAAKAELLQAVRRIQPLSTGTMTGLAIQFAITKALSDAEGGRPRSPDISKVRAHRNVAADSKEKIQLGFQGQKPWPQEGRRLYQAAPQGTQGRDTKNIAAPLWLLIKNHLRGPHHTPFLQIKKHGLRKVSCISNPGVSGH